MHAEDGKHDGFNEEMRVESCGGGRRNVVTKREDIFACGEIWGNSVGERLLFLTATSSDQSFETKVSQSPSEK